MQSRLTRNPMDLAWAFVVTALLIPRQGAAQNASAAASTAATATSSTLGVVALVLCAALLIWIATRVLRALASSTSWSLADALSEEVPFTETQTPVAGAASVTTTTTRLVPSSSRLVMLFGLILIGSLYGGFGAVALYDYASSGSVPNLGGVQSFLLCGLSLFAPYAANQLKSAVTSVAGK